ncbi:cob(I)yrinic acid a,c-diamide adenosyltransferase [bacterium]|nr:cob(I)yrinic acid a,c-diamide adenosyltransferase [bacterium]
MSIATKTGDKGTTGLMYGRRVPKYHPRVEAYAAVDETNAAIGMARATGGTEFVCSELLKIQKQLVDLMGELATANEDLERYERDGFTRVTDEMVTPLDELVKELEGKEISFKGWATPGANQHSAALDLARVACRRAERRVCRLIDEDEISNQQTVVFLNRLSDVLWLFARWVEKE